MGPTLNRHTHYIHNTRHKYHTVKSCPSGRKSEMRSEDSIKMHETRTLTLLCNRTVAQRSLQSHTWKSCVCACVSLCVCVCVCVNGNGKLVLICGLSFCQHITICTQTNQCWSQNTDLMASHSNPRCHGSGEKQQAAKGKPNSKRK